MMKSMSLQSSKDADREGATKMRKNYVLDLPVANIKIPLQVGAVKQETWGEGRRRFVQAGHSHAPEKNGH